MLRVEQTPISAGPDLVDNVGFEITVDCARHIFSLACLREEGAEALVWIRSFTLLGEITIGLYVESNQSSIALP